jgi:hypothetical protein
LGKRREKLANAKTGDVGMNALPLLLAALNASAAAAQELPAIPEDLLNVTAVSCLKMDNSGAVVGAFLIQSTGDEGRDREVVAWVKKLRWDKAERGDKLRNVWFPMPIAFGNVTPPAMPASCSPASTK